MAYEELFADLLKAEREEDVTAAPTIFNVGTGTYPFSS
jgi:hypothetical protein